MLFPHSFEARFSDVEIFYIGALALPDPLMPFEMKPKDQVAKLVTLQSSRDFLKILNVGFFECNCLYFLDHQLLIHLI